MKKYKKPVATTIHFSEMDIICSSPIRSLEDLYVDPNNVQAGDSRIDIVTW